jgi:acyl transferase domain-containing protein/surfactin synthase thioesterase subunit
MACRFPGASDHRTFWDNLVCGVESVTFFSDAELRAAGETPELLRQPQYVKATPILTAHDEFDAAFFGYAPREARLMDPQQRLFLEVAWEAFEDAGYDPLGHKGVVGVYAGAGGLVSSYMVRLDHPDLRGQTGDLGHIGNDRDFLASRVSFKLNLTGPSVNVQTACSTSLVALHLACRGLLDGEAEMALAGASVVRIPHIRGYVAEPGNIYSADGHCRPFDAKASGTLFGSGVAAVLLKPLAAALQAGDHVYAVIKGAAVTNDGGQKITYTASTARAQARAATDAMTIAGVAPDSIGFVECHGTATALGDPLEIQALTQAFRASTSRVGFCAIGSVKSNVGHLEQCAGMAGLFKAVLAVKHGVIPPTLHFETPNPRILFDRSPFIVETATRPFDRSPGRRRAGVNSVGMGGTNAFVVLEEPPPPTRRRRQPPRSPLMLTLSAQSQPALVIQTQNLRAVLGSGQAPDVRDVCFTANQGRHHFGYRFCAVGNDREELVAQLERFANDTHSTPASDTRGRAAVAFLFSGQGAQYPRMGEALYRTEPTFRDALDKCITMFAAAGIPLADALFGDGDGRLHRTLYAQPALFSLQVALTELWRSWGVMPGTVIGHSVGEFAAAVAAGVCSVEDAARLVATRALLMEALPDGGAMLSIAADGATVEAAFPAAGDVSVAAVNAPDRTTVAGSTAALAALAEHLRQRAIPVMEVNASHAFHSALMDPILTPFERFAGTVSFGAPRVRWISTVSGEEITVAPDARYWRDQVRLPVRFHGAMDAAAPLATAFLEIGPGATLINLGRRCLRGRAPTTPVEWVASLTRDNDEPRGLLDAVRQLYLNGQDIRWDAIEGRGRRVSLPTYPFQRRRWWLEQRAADSATSAAVSETRRLGPHPLLGTRLGSEDVRFEVFVDLHAFPFLDGHRVFDRVVYPTTAALDAVTAAAVRGLGFSRPVIADFLYESPLTLSADQPTALHVVLESGATGTTFRVESTGLDDGAEWQVIATGMVRDESDATTLPPFPSHALRSRSGEVDIKGFYRFLAARGLSYGPTFQGIAGLWRGEDEAFARVTLPAQAMSDGYGIHPAFLDACLHSYAALVRKHGGFDTEDAPRRRAYVPIGMESFHVYRFGVTSGWVHGLVLARDGEDEARLRVDIRVYGDDGGPVALFRGVTIQETDDQRFAMPPDSRLAPLLYRLEWREAPRRAEAAALPKSWCVVADASGVGAHLVKRLEGEGCRVTTVTLRLASDALDWTDLRHFDALVEAPPDEPIGVVYLPALDTPASSVASRAPTAPIGARVAEACIGLVRALDRARGHVTADTRLWLVTRAAQATDACKTVAGVAQAPLWGLGRTIALEYSALWGGLIDLPTGLDAETTAGMLLTELKTGGDEDQIVVREGRRLAVRLAPLSAMSLPPRRRLEEDATHWIIGGLGGVGLETAKALVSAGARHLVLTGRHASDAGGGTALERLRRDAEVVVLASDASNAGDVDAVLSYIHANMPPLRGVVHAAAVFDDAVLANLTREQLHRALEPKVAGAWLVSRATRTLDLDYFVLFSSVLGVWGSAGQAGYTAGNAFLDALVAFRRAAGLPATVFNWGPWSEVGGAERWGPVRAALWKQRGTLRLSPAIYLEAFLRFLNGEHSQLIVIDTEWRQFLSQFAEVPPMFRELAPATQSSGTAPLDTSEPERLIDLVRSHVSRVLGVDTAIPVTQPINELGLDSLLAVNLANRLRHALKVPIPTAMLLMGPSIAKLVAELFPQALPASPTPPQQQEHATARVAGDRWLIFHRPNPGARVRLFCFPFAGGGAATFRAWPPLLSRNIELVAIEPPGRQTRIDEAPIRDLATFLEGLVPALLPFLDKPFAVYGHCLGALTLFETVRTLVRDLGRMPVHVFVSGGRPPDEIHRQQKFEMKLAERLLALPGYSVFEPVHRQPDDVFAEAILQFDVIATGSFLSDPELRRLMLPVIRAEFEMSSKYRYLPEPPWDVPITCLTGIHDKYVSPENARSWSRFTQRRFQLFMVETKHFMIVDDEAFVIKVINRELEGLA